MNCWECEKESAHLHDHHVVPRSRGGTKTVPLCQLCHSKAHHRNKSMSTSQLTKEGLARRKAEGYILGAPPYGYTKQNGVLIEIPEEQAIIARAVELRKGGMNIAAIARELGFTYRSKVNRLIERATGETGEELAKENICLYCNKPAGHSTGSTKRRRKFCSEKCGHAFRYNKKMAMVREERADRNCLYCNAEIAIDRHMGTLYCTTKCGNNHYRSRVVREKKQE
jgi:hypothetical protein